MKKVLTIAGSDSGAGAGVQADLKVFAARGVYGTCAITALTAQNTLGVDAIKVIDPDFVAKQIDSVMQDIGADIWKTGMLVNEKIINIVIKKAKEYKIEKIIVDPVMISTNGNYLLEYDANKALINNLIPKSYLLTPNSIETEVITQIKINNVNDAEKAAKKIYHMGAKNVLVKGGHIPDENNAIDILYNGKDIIKISSPRIKSMNTHGTGCSYASSIAAEIAKGNDLETSIRISKEYITNAIIFAKDFRIGSGHGPLNLFFQHTIKKNPK
ncbi:MAG: bifunctional hydroxymethylpyrimidine kinase/phosphomethylpyrimidine kinase [Candidatus Lokiarchaeota archaeon]|nr:bifunctional hydroxymethylpyrimidine kinase/phosphomethylpyrimidine kinase [Candidatus Lokiarchaeota archaeon]